MREHLALLLAALDLRGPRHPAKKTYPETNDTANSFAHDHRVLKRMCKEPLRANPPRGLVPCRQDTGWRDSRFLPGPKPFRNRLAPGGGKSGGIIHSHRRLVDHPITLYRHMC